MLPCTYYLDKIIWGGLWVGAHAGLFTWAFLEEQARTDNTKNKEMLGLFLPLARAAARCLNFEMAMILFPVCRTFLTWIKRIPLLGKAVPFDKHIKFHIIVAWSMIFFTAVHTIAHLFNIRLLQIADPVKYHPMLLLWTTWAGLTGVIMVVILFLMSTSGFHIVRRNMFELFWYVHHLFWLFFASAVTHAFSCILKTDGGVCYKKTTWQWVLAGLICYTLEIVARWIRAYRTTYIRKIVWHPNGTFEVQFDKPSMVVRAGEYVHLCVPEISPFQWHPYTLTYCQEEGFHSVHIRVLGDWTRDFAKKVKCMDEKDKWVNADALAHLDYSKLPRMLVDGPFGTPSESAFQYEVCMMIGGGIGVTPFASLLKQIWYTAQRPGYNMKLRKVYFVWVARSTYSFEWFQDLLASMQGEAFDRFIDVQVYLTGKLDPATAANVMINDGVNGKDAITNLRAPTHYGRPSIPHLYQRIKDECYVESRLNCGVFFCGPPVLAHILRKEAHRASDHLANFNFKKEIF